MKVYLLSVLFSVFVFTGYAQMRGGGGPEGMISIRVISFLNSDTTATFVYSKYMFSDYHLTDDAIRCNKGSEVFVEIFSSSTFFNMPIDSSAIDNGILICCSDTSSPHVNMWGTAYTAFSHYKKFLVSGSATSISIFNQYEIPLKREQPDLASLKVEITGRTASQLVSFSNQNAYDMQVRVIDINGRVVSAENLSTYVHLNLSELPAGVYILELMWGNSSERRKFMLY